MKSRGERQSDSAKWAVVNQTYAPSFQRLLERLAGDFGPCLVLTGTPFGVSSSSLHLAHGPSYSRKSAASRIWTWLAFTLWAAARLVREKPEGPVLLVSNPPLLPPLAAALRAILKQPVVVLVWDIYPEVAIRSGLLRRSGVVAKTWGAIQRWSLRNSARVVTIGDEMARVVREELGPHPEPTMVSVIPNWADENLFVGTAQMNERHERKRTTSMHVTVLYAGNLGDTHDLDAIVETATRVASEAGIRFEIVGDGTGREGIESAIRERGLTNVRIRNPVPWEEFPTLLATADVGIVSQRVGLEDLSMPSKTYSYLASGLAILAFTKRECDLGRLVSQEGLGVVAGPGEEAEAAAFLRRARSEPSQLEAMQQRARAVAREKYSEEVAATAWSELLAKVRDQSEKTPPAIGPVL